MYPGLRRAESRIALVEALLIFTGSPEQNVAGQPPVGPRRTAAGFRSSSCTQRPRFRQASVRLSIRSSSVPFVVSKAASAFQAAVSAADMGFLELLRLLCACSRQRVANAS